MNGMKCILCGRETGEALNILGRSICRQCEREILTVDASDHQYDAFLSKLRDVSTDALHDRY